MVGVGKHRALRLQQLDIPLVQNQRLGVELVHSDFELGDAGQSHLSSKRRWVVRSSVRLVIPF